VTGATLSGLGGSDLLIDGSGSDTLSGGAGADVFMLAPDGLSDTILDFNPAEDWIDLTGFTGLRTPDDIRIKASNTGMWLIFGGERLNLITATGSHFDSAQLLARLVFNQSLLLTPPTPLPSLPVVDTSGDDMFIWSASDSKTIAAGPGRDLMNFLSAPAAVQVDLSGATLNGGAAAGYILGGIEDLAGSAYSDRLTAGSAGASLSGNSGDDVLNGGIGDDVLNGGIGRDTLTGGGGNDTIIGGAGNDQMLFALASTAFSASSDDNHLILASAEGINVIANDVEIFVFLDRTLSYAEVALLRSDSMLIGTTQTDNLVGTVRGEHIYGMGGNDWLTPGAGNDTIDGGTGVDMVSFSNQAGPTNINLRLGLALCRAERDRLLNIESVTGSIYSDLLEGDRGANRLRGLGDYDWIVGSGGNDTIEGGTGRDMISYISASAAVTVDLGQKKGLAGQALGDVYDGIERVTGSSYGDTFYGDALENDFRGMAGNDLFYSSAGGRERYDGGAGLDTVSYALAAAAVTASLRLGSGSRGDAARDLYTAIENLTGTRFGDSLSGDDATNVLQGLGGDDFLFADAGIDRLYGGAGNDMLDGGAGSDYAYFNGTRDQFSLTKLSATTATVTGIGPTIAEGQDRISNVEYIVFTDQTVAIWDL
jgi:Ca2+-binding RTX toxin-like protein